ncbi:MAG: hypothetical protein Q7J38_15205 [Gallionella sp.]|nr:hypothetical protein [Gallionella sp.]
MSKHINSNSEQDESQGFNTKAWYGVMGFCIVGLGILGFVSKDSSVHFYVMWAIILICFAPELEKMMAAYMKAIKMIELLKNEEIKRKVAEERKRKTAEDMERQASAG